MTTWISAGLLITGTDDPPIPKPVVRIENGVLRELRSANPDEPASLKERGEFVLEFAEATLMPGLVDAHVHLCFCPDGRPMGSVAHDSLETLTFRALANAQSALAAGVTTLRDCGGRGFVVPAVRDAIQRGAVVGPRILSCAMPITTTRGHLYYCGAEADSTDELLKRVREFAKSGVDFIKVCATGGRNTPGSNVFACQYRPEQLRALTDDSHRLELRVASHALSTAGIRDSVSARVDTVEHCLWLSPVGTDYEEAVVSEMIENAIYAGFNFSGDFRRALDPDGNVDFSRIEEPAGELRARMKDAGVRYFLSTDAGIPYMRHDDFALAIEVGARFMNLSPMEAILAVTREPARAIGAEDIGTLEIGKRADMLVLNGNPLKHLRALRDIRAVLRDGVLVAERRGDATWLLAPGSSSLLTTGESPR